VKASILSLMEVVHSPDDVRLLVGSYCLKRPLCLTVFFDRGFSPSFIRPGVAELFAERGAALERALDITVFL